MIRKLKILKYVLYHWTLRRYRERGRERSKAFYLKRGADGKKEIQTLSTILYMEIDVKTYVFVCAYMLK